MRFTNLYFIIFTLAVCTNSQAVILSEIMFNPEGEEGSDEFIELYNESSLPVNLTGWTLSDGEGTDTLTGLEMGLTAGPRQYILILDPDYFDDESITYDGLIPESALVITIIGSTFGSRGLSNSSSETVSIMQSNGNVVAMHSYDIETSAGHSTEKYLMNGGDSAENWGQSLSIHGTPGARNSITPPDYDLAIEQIEASPQHPNPNEEFTISITVANHGLNPASDSLFLFEMTNQYDSLGTALASWLSPLLSYGDSAVFTHSLHMDEQSAGYYRASLKTSDDLSENNTALLTVGASAGTGSIVINEIMFQPLAGRSEWIELYNCSPASIVLDGWSFSDGSGLADSSKRFPIQSTIMDSNNYMLLAADSSVFIENITEGTPVHIWNSSYPSLNNAGDSLVLFDAQGQTIDRVDYRINWGSGTAGLSLERVSVLSSSNDPLNWASSLDASGATPGRLNSRALIAAAAGDKLIELEPNPFSPDGDGREDVLSIRYHLDEADSRLDIKIFDVRGRQVRFLSNNMPAGFQGEILWDGKSDSGRELPTGMYIIYLEALGQGGDRVQSGKRVVALARPS